MKRLGLTLMFVAACSSPSGGDGDCAVMDMFPDPEEISLTPREDVEAERLALTCSDGWVPDQAVYETLLADLAAIRAADPAMADIRDYASQPLDDNELLVEVTDSATLDRILAGSDEEFQCVLDAMGGTASKRRDDDGEAWAFVRFDGAVYDLAGVETMLESLASVKSVDQNYLVGDGDTIRYDIGASSRRYLFDEAGGDCPSGCTTHHYYLWEVSDDASPALLGEWGNDDQEGTFGEQPAGFSFDDFECRKCEDGHVAQGIDENCTDGIDNDCDGAIDCDDSACRAEQVCAPEICDNGVDDDADGQTDCGDDDCVFNAVCGGLTCGSTTDSEWIRGREEGRGLFAFILRDALACTPGDDTLPADGEVTACITTTLTTNDVSHGCATCLGDYGECGMTDCHDSCWPDFDRPECATCVDTNCAPAAETCLGQPVADLGNPR